MDSSRAQTDANWQRAVIHADLDCFFAAAELRRHPELRGKPVIVGGRPGGCGIVASASYEARAYGVRSAMPAGQAARLCPDAVFLPVDGPYYRELSRAFREILDRFSPVVEMVSVDEAYIDLTHTSRTFGHPGAAAEQIKRAVRDELGLIVSLGVATGRSVAKIASDLDKPDGLRIVEPGSEAFLLAPMPIERLPGIGPKTAARLHQIGIRTLGGLSAVPEMVLRSIFGQRAAEIIERAMGIDPRPVVSEPRQAKSISRMHTFDRDLVDAEEIRQELATLAGSVGRSLRRDGVQGGVVGVTVRYRDFETVGRQRRLPLASSDDREIVQVATRLIDELLERRRDPVRLLGVHAGNLTRRAIQLRLFDDEPLRRRRLTQALDDLAERHGADVTRPADALVGRPRFGRRVLEDELVEVFDLSEQFVVQPRLQLESEGEGQWH